MLQLQSSSLLRSCAPLRRVFAPAVPSAGNQGTMWTPLSRHTLMQGSPVVQRLVVARSSDGQSKDKPVAYNKQFGYSRKDVLLIGGGLIGLGFGLYYGLQAFGMDAGIAGNWVQLIIFMGICVGWVSTYLFRVATKQMTYVKQLEAYEDAVMKKRVEEMTEEELQQLIQEAEAAKGKGQAPRS